MHPLLSRSDRGLLTPYGRKHWPQHMRDITYIWMLSAYPHAHQLPYNQPVRSSYKMDAHCAHTDTLRFSGHTGRVLYSSLPICMAHTYDAAKLFVGCYRVICFCIDYVGVVVRHAKDYCCRVLSVERFRLDRFHAHCEQSLVPVTWLPDNKQRLFCHLFNTIDFHYRENTRVDTPLLKP